MLTFKFDPEAEEVIDGWVDANHPSDAERKSTTGFAVYLQGVQLSTASKTQGVIALSTDEAELIALCACAAECLYVQNLLTQFLHKSLPIQIHCDSAPTIATASRLGVGRMRHLETKFLWIQKLVQDKRIKLLKCKTTENLADVLTKQLLPTPLEKAAARLNLTREQMVIQSP